MLLGALHAETLTLDQVVQQAIDRNLDLAAERYSISVAEARQITARLRPNPVITVLAQTLDLLGTGFNANNPSGPNQITYHTDFILERKQKREGRIQVAAVDKTIAEAGVREVIRRVIYSAQSAFLDVLQAKENLALAQANQRTLEAIVEINQAKVRAGELAQVELERSQVAALQFQTSVHQAQLNVEQAKLRLQLVLGRPAAAADFDVEGQFRRDALSPDRAELARQAIEKRPDLLAVQRTQARSRADLTLQLANSKIDFTVGAEYTRQWTNYGSGNSMGFSFSMPLPVFNRNQGEIARAQREIDQAGARMTALQASISNEVELAYRQYATSKLLLENVEGNILGKAKSVREITEYSYRRGEASLLEFLDAQRAFNDAMQSYNDARASYARSLYLIDSVSGASVADASTRGSKP